MKPRSCGKAYTSCNTEAFSNTWRISASYCHFGFWAFFFLWQPNSCGSYHHPGLSAYIKSPWQQCSITGKGFAENSLQSEIEGALLLDCKSHLPKLCFLKIMQTFSHLIFFYNEKHWYFVLLLLHVSVIHFIIINQRYYNRSYSYFWLAILTPKIAVILQFLLP